MSSTRYATPFSLILNLILVLIICFHQNDDEVNICVEFASIKYSHIVREGYVKICITRILIYKQT